MTTRPYRPSNGTEGMLFFENWCDRCIHDRKDQQCGILTRTLIHDIGDSEYPGEWIEDDVTYPHDSNPRCTAFAAEKFDTLVRPAGRD